MEGTNYQNNDSEVSFVDSTEHCDASYEEVLHRIEELLDATPDQVNAFIENRLHNLESNSDPNLELSHIGNNQYEGFISQKADIVRNFICDRLHVDDPEIFRLFFDTIRTFKKTPGWDCKTVREILPFAVQWTLASYFGNHTGTTKGEMRNRAIYMDVTTAESTGLSVRALRNENCGVCCEKASAAQNLLSFVGAESRIVFSAKCELPEGNTGGDAHVYILLKTSTGKYLYDPANPSAVLDAEANTLISCMPEIHKLTDEDYDAIVSGKDVTVTHRDVRRFSDGHDETVVQRYKYSGAKAFG
jgi:hypothetical protein